MMKPLILTVALAAAGMCAAHAQSYTIRGTAPESENGKTVYLIEHVQNKTLDSTVVEEGKFTFIRSDKGLRRLQLKQGGVAVVVAEPGTITADLSDLKLVGGTPLNDSLSVQFERMQKYYEALNELRNDTTLTLAEKIERSKAYGERYTAAAIASFKANRNNVFGAHVLSEVAPDMAPEQYLAYYDEGGPEVRDFGPLKDIKRFKEASLATMPGKPFDDFEGTDSTGRPVKLSDYAGKGKYVLVDFWASWCGPCRQETPVVARAYEKYKNKGLEVVGLFVWDKPKNLDKAVKDLHIGWPQIIDSNNTVCDLYGVQGIPHIMLIGPDGTILARDLRGEGIEQAIAEYLR